MTRLGRAIAAGVSRLLGGATTGLSTQSTSKATDAPSTSGIVPIPTWQVRQPIWDPKRPRKHAGSSNPDDKKGNKRQRDNAMRAGLPKMSGRQWDKLRKRMYREARRLTREQRHTQQPQENAP